MQYLPVTSSKENALESRWARVDTGETTNYLSLPAPVVARTGVTYLRLPAPVVTRTDVRLTI